MTQPPFHEAGNRHLEQMRTRIRKNPNDGKAWFNLARALAAHPPGQELFHAIEQSIKSLPHDHNTWVLAASVQQQIKGPVNARRWLEQTAQQNPGLAAPRLALASLLLDQGQIDAAIEEASRAIELDAGSADARAIRGDAYRQAGTWGKALVDYRKIEKLRAKDPILMNNIGCCLSAQDDYDAARDYFRKALRRRPGFTEASLNLALLYATRRDYDEAISRIGAILEDSAIDPATRRPAEAILAVLCEQQRLEPILQCSLQSGDVGELHSALQETPEKLLHPDKNTVDRLHALAAICSTETFAPLQADYSADTRRLSFIEACRHSRLAGDADTMSEMHQALQERPPIGAGQSRESDLRSACRVILDRSAFNADQLQGGEGEAWLRYWHARLMVGAPEKLPGQYKTFSNAIGQIPLTPPEGVAGTIRVMLSEILPTVPAGWPRALFLLVGTLMIHGFADGNGRLARFLLAWELESADLSPVVIPESLRKRAAESYNVAMLGGGLDPLKSVLVEAKRETERLLKQLES